MKRPLDGEEGPLAQQQYLARLQELQSASDSSLTDFTKTQNSYPQGNSQHYTQKHILLNGYDIILSHDIILSAQA